VFSFPQVPHQNPYAYVPHTPPISLLLILSPEQYLMSTIHKAPRYVVFSTPPRYIVHLGAKYFPQHPIKNGPITKTDSFICDSVQNTTIHYITITIHTSATYILLLRTDYPKTLGFITPSTFAFCKYATTYCHEEGTEKPRSPRHKQDLCKVPSLENFPRPNLSYCITACLQTPQHS
jgi:hypothetical protein